MSESTYSPFMDGPPGRRSERAYKIIGMDLGSSPSISVSMRAVFYRGNWYPYEVENEPARVDRLPFEMGA